LDAIALCGSADLPCPISSPPSSPGQIFTQRPLDSPETKANEFITFDDYVDDEEDMAVVIAKILQQEEMAKVPIATSSVRNLTDKYPSPTDLLS
jgi:hypothetical protein